MESSFVAFIDESCAFRPQGWKVYMVCAALVEPERIGDMRMRLEPLLLPGQKKLHWTDENIRRKLVISREVGAIGNMNAIVSHYGGASGQEERFRRKRLEQIYFELEAMGVCRVVLESRTTKQDAEDQAHIVALQQKGVVPNIRIEHKPSGDEPLLWIPDAVLGALNLRHKGQGECWGLLSESIVLEKKTPESANFS